MSMSRIASILGVILFSHLGAAAEVRVEDARVRPTAPGQRVAGAFMKLTADADMVLVKGASPMAKRVELHFMRMDGGMMEMREMKKIDLPRDTTVSLEPGGIHVMLIGLKARIQAGDRVPLTLVARDAKGVRKPLTVTLEARAFEE